MVLKIRLIDLWKENLFNEVNTVYNTIFFTTYGENDWLQSQFLSVLRYSLLPLTWWGMLRGWENFFLTKLILVRGRGMKPSSTSFVHKQIINYTCFAPLVVLFYIYHTVMQEICIAPGQKLSYWRAPRHLCVKTGDVSIEWSVADHEVVFFTVPLTVFRPVSLTTGRCCCNRYNWTKLSNMG